MLNSKALKEPKERFLKLNCGCPKGLKHNHGFFINICHKILSFVMHKVYYPTENFYKWNKKRIKRSYDYARFGWDNYDWNFAYVYALLEFKLKRLHKTLEKGHSIQEEKDMKALKDLTKVVRRLRKNGYDNWYYRSHDRKWGKLESRFEPIPGETSSRWISWRVNRPENASDEVKQQERDELKLIWENAEKDRRKDIDRLAYILKEHADKFWD